MKKLRIVSLLMSMLMVFLMTGCGDIDANVSVGDVTFYTDVSVIEDGATNEEQSDSKDTSSSVNTSGNSNTTQSNNASTGGSTQTSSGNATSSGGSTQKPAGNNGSTWEQVKAKIPANAKGKTIEVYSWNEVTDVTGAKDVIADFTKETGIKVKWTVGTYDDYTTKIAAMVASKTAPDVVRLKGLDLGLIQVLTPVKNLGYDFTDAAWDKRICDFYTFKGNTYAVNMRNTLLQQPRALIYNTGLISKYDLEDPYTLWKKGKWTWDKFEEICETFTNETDDTHLAWTSYRWADAADVYGTSFIKRNGDSFKENYTDANLIKGWQTMTRFVEKGYTNNVRFDRSNFESGKILFFTESPIGVRRTHYYFSNLKKTGSIKIVPMPTVKGGTTATIMGEVEAYGVPQGAKNASLVPYFLRYYLDGDNYDKNTFFVNKSVLDVYETLMANDKIFVNSDVNLITEDVGLGGIHLNARIVNVKPAQVASKIETESGYIKAAVKSANGIISKLK